MERFLNEVQEFIQRCIDGKNSSNVTVIMNESYYEYGYDNENRHVTIRTRDVNKELDNDKDLDYFYCQECGRKVYYSKNSMFMPHPQLCSFCESHNF